MDERFIVYPDLPAVVPGTQSDLYISLACQAKALHSSQRAGCIMPLLSIFKHSTSGCLRHHEEGDSG